MSAARFPSCLRQPLGPGSASGAAASRGTWKHIPTPQETAGLVVSPGFRQKTPSDPSDPSPARSRSGAASDPRRFAGVRAVGISQEQGLIPKNHTLPFYRPNAHCWCCPGRVTLEICIPAWPSFPTEKGTDRMCPPATHPKHQPRALVAPLPPPQLSCLPRQRKPEGNLCSWGGCWHQTISEDQSQPFSQLLDITHSLSAKGRQEEVGQPLLAPLLLNYPKNGILQKPKPLARVTPAPREPRKGDWRKAWLFAAPL